MNIKVEVKEVDNKEDHYDLRISNYKNSKSNLEERIGGLLEGRFERSELRNLIEIIDNSITVGCR